MTALNIFDVNMRSRLQIYFFRSAKKNNIDSERDECVYVCFFVRNYLNFFRNYLIFNDVIRTELYHLSKFLFDIYII